MKVFEKKYTPYKKGEIVGMFCPISRIWSHGCEVINDDGITVLVRTQNGREYIPENRWVWRASELKEKQEYADYIHQLIKEEMEGRNDEVVLNALRHSLCRLTYVYG